MMTGETQADVDRRQSLQKPDIDRRWKRKKVTRLEIILGLALCLSVAFAVINHNRILFAFNEDGDQVEYEHQDDEPKTSTLDQVEHVDVDAIVHEDKPVKNESMEEKKESEQEEKEDKRLNVLILYPDDWRHDSIGSEKPYVLTPFLNQLADEGIRFTQNAVTTSICWLSRATLFLGQYTSRHKSYLPKCPRFSSAENWKHSWVSMLRNSGYYVGHIGKWQYWHFREKMFDWNDLFEVDHWFERNNVKVHASELAKQAAFEFLKVRPKDKPFALSIAFYPPKALEEEEKPGGAWKPTNETQKLYENTTIPEPEMKESYKQLPSFLQQGEAKYRFDMRFSTSVHYQAAMKNYYALITGVDKACKEIIDKLKEDNLYDNTMIIFTTDNGLFHGEHGLAGKWYPYQESIRVPLIIYDPRMPSDKIGTLDDSFTLNVDLAQTILGAAGIKPHDLMQGRDISDLYLTNEKNEHHNTMSVDSEPWRTEFFYEFPSPFEDEDIPASTALVRKEWKLIDWSRQENYQQLFNLKNDPLEQHDLFDNPEAQSMLETMRKRHDELKGELHDSTYTNLTECDAY